jgi:hypothetical protein
MAKLSIIGRVVPLVAVAIACLGWLTPAAAQATRTWVSGVGDDANPCSRTAPCKTFAGAISKTAAGGEINVIDSGGFGAVTITKSITINGSGGPLAGVLVAGTNGIVVSAGVNDTVTLRNLDINGLLGSASPGLNGVQFNAGGALIVEDCKIFGFSQNGININANTASPVRVVVTDTTVSNSAGGIAARNASTGRVTVSLHRVTLAKNNSFGFKADGTGGAASIIAAVSDSLIAGNATGVWSAGGALGNPGIQVTRSSVVNNVAAGILADGSANSIVLVSKTLVTGNGTGLSAVAGAGLATYQNNEVHGNLVDGTFTAQFPPQ